jgi:ribonuclease P protein component
MMLPRNKRLRTRDVSYLVKRRIYKHMGYFGFFYVANKYNNSHLFAVHVGLKFSKKAVHRHRLKRLVMSVIQDDVSLHKSIAWQYYKFFITLTPQGIDYYSKLLASGYQKSMFTDVRVHFLQSFTRLSQRLWIK